MTRWGLLCDFEALSLLDLAWKTDMSTPKERPLCRKAIETRKLRPYLVDGAWDGFTVVDPDGLRSGLSVGMRTQMRLMVAEGRWGEMKLKRWKRSGRRQ